MFVTVFVRNAMHVVKQSNGFSDYDCYPLAVTITNLLVSSTVWNWNIATLEIVNNSKFYYYQVIPLLSNPCYFIRESHSFYKSIDTAIAQWSTDMKPVKDSQWVFFIITRYLLLLLVYIYPIASVIKFIMLKIFC